MRDLERVVAAATVGAQFMRDAVEEKRIPSVLVAMHELSLAMLQVAEISHVTGWPANLIIGAGAAKQFADVMDETLAQMDDDDMFATKTYILILEYISRYVPELEGVLDEYHRSL